MTTSQLFLRLPAYLSFYRFKYPKLLPFNYTLNISFQCNSRCQTCNVWKKQVDELKMDEWEKVFQSLGHLPYWVTISGGEPFLQAYLLEFCQKLYQICQPAIINIPTNAVLYQKIPQIAEQIIKSCPKSKIVINLSLDGVGEDHDKIRGVPGNFEKWKKTYEALRQFNYPNFIFGIHSVMSKLNIDPSTSLRAGKFKELVEYSLSLNPDQYIFEIAEERGELDTIGMDITPSAAEYAEVIKKIRPFLIKKKQKGLARISQAFRMIYIDLVDQYLQNPRQTIPCYAGIASAQISADGQVWPCCIRANNVGNLRNHDYNFKKIWFDEKANEVRKSIKNRECGCPLANAAYSNMLLNPKILMRVVKNILF